MLISSDLSHTLTVQTLVQIWVERYNPQTPFSAAQHSTVFDTLVHAASPEGRFETVSKLHRSVIKLNCEFAATQARELHDQALSTTSSNEAKQIVRCAVEIYSDLLEFYKQSSVYTEQMQNGKGDLMSVGLSVADITKLAGLLEPLLLEYQDRHQTSDDWSKIGFLTTYLNFSNVALLNNLTTAERIFVKPYFKFLEEQVALPWQRICAAASSHQFSSPAFQLVKHMLPNAEEIAHRVYMKLVQQFPKTTTRRGRLDHPGVRHSCIRDLNMFQAYLWLCVLQGSLAPVEDELVRLCTMVMPRVGVPWEMTVRWNALLMEEVTDRALIGQHAFLEPYTIGFRQLFQESQSRFEES
jgi:Phycobilisome protein